MQKSAAKIRIIEIITKYFGKFTAVFALESYHLGLGKHAEEDDEVAEQLFLAGGIVMVIADGITTDGYPTRTTVGGGGFVLNMNTK